MILLWEALVVIFIVLIIYRSPLKKRNIGQPPRVQKPFRDVTNLEKITEADVIVIGGAAAGLSTGACLNKDNVSNIVLEKFDNSGDQWRKRYHRLHLHDIVEECSLPYFPVPESFPTYPTRLQYATYLDSYAKCMNVDVRYRHTVKQAKFSEENKLWTVRVAIDDSIEPPVEREFKGTHLVIANGVYNDPVVPEIPGIEDFAGQIIHTSVYTNATDLGLQGKKVLIVGFGNSGCEILIDLVEHGAKPTIVQRSPLSIVARDDIQTVQTILYKFGFLIYFPFIWVVLPFFFICLDILLKISSIIKFGALKKKGLKLQWKPPITNMILTFAPPTMDVGTVDCILSGKANAKYARTSKFTEKGVVFDDGTSEDFDCVIFATGFQVISGHRAFLDESVCDRIGSGFKAARQRTIVTGRESKYPNLWFIYGRLQMIRDSAPAMASSIAAKLGRPVSKLTRFRKLALYHLVTSVFLLSYYLF